MAQATSAMKLEKGGRRRPESASGVRKAPQKPGACELTWPAARASEPERPEAAKERDEGRGVSSINFLAGLIAALHRPGCNEAPDVHSAPLFGGRSHESRWL